MPDAEELLALLTNAVAKIKERNVAIAFSGGLDSAVIAKIACERMGVTLYTVGLSGCKDFAAAESAAKILGLQLRKIEVSEAEVAEAANELAKVIRNDNRLVISYTLPLWFVCSKCSENVVLSGQGADELFAGYAKYQNCAKLEETLKDDAMRLRSKGILTDKAVAAKFGKELITPYLDSAVFDFALKIPVARKISGVKNKIILREVADMLDLGMIAQRPKKAAQYGSGISKVLSKWTTG